MGETVRWNDIGLFCRIYGLDNLFSGEYNKRNLTGGKDLCPVTPYPMKGSKLNMN